MSGKHALLLAMLFFILTSMGCTAVPDPTPTLQNVAGEVVTAEGVRPLGTATSMPSTIPPADNTPTTESLLPTSTPIPSLTLLPTSQLTATPLSDLVWEQNASEIITVNSGNLVWSPVTNEFVFDTCPDERSAQPEQFMFVANAPKFEAANISPSGVTCRYTADLIWRPDGQQVVFRGLPAPQDDLFESDIWMMSRDGLNTHNFERMGKFIEFAGWMDNDSLAYRDNYGNGNWLVHILDVNTNNEVASAFIHGTDIQSISEKYVAVEESIHAYSTHTTGVISSIPIGVENQRNSFYALSYNYETFELAFDARFVDWLPKTSQMLVRTSSTEERLNDSVTNTDLQIWNVESDTLTIIVPGGIDGRFSPDGRYILYLTQVQNSSQLQLLDQDSGNIIFTSPAFAEIGVYEIYNFVNDYTSFSPDGRTLTFYSPTPELMVYDLETDEFMPPLTACPSLTCAPKPPIRWPAAAANASPTPSGHLTART